MGSNNRSLPTMYDPMDRPYDLTFGGIKMDSEQIIKIVNSLDSETYHCMGKVIFGHEIWLENAVTNGNVSSADLVYGHNMAYDGKAPKEYVNPTVFDSKGKPVKYEVGELENGYRISFNNEGTSPYTMYIESIPVIWNQITDGTWKAGVKRDYSNVKNSASYQMYAKIIFADPEPSKVEQAVLEIIPGTSSISVGKEIQFLVKYEGKPLTNKEVKMFCKKTGQEIFKNTDERGAVSIAIDHCGDWMFLVRHKDGSKSVDNEFDEAVFITTLVMRA